MRFRKFFVELVVLLSILVVSCQKKPMACFTSSKTTAAINESISFSSACSMDGRNYQWDFGDGLKSTEQNPTHSFSTTGTFTIKCMVMSKNSKKMDETSALITIQ